MNTSPHTPVLLNTVLEVLDPQPGETYIDVTAGFGGHAAAVLERIGEAGRAILIDQDPAAVSSLRERFRDDARVQVFHQNFADLDLDTLPPADMILADLGVSSLQLDDPARGFSFRAEGPLDMRMNTDSGVSLQEFLADIDEVELADIIWRFGEERRSRQIARAIIVARDAGSLQTTVDLAQAIRGQSVGKPGRIDPATRTFQALRIALNQELTALDTLLEIGSHKLAPGGRFAVISFHSLEDRKIKQKMRDMARDICDTITGQALQESNYRLLTKKPLTAAPSELDYNPRARSAKLRAVEKKK